MEKRYKYRLDRRSRRITAVLTVVVVLLVGGLLVLSGGYLPAWIIFFIVSVITLYILSIPRYVSLDDEALDVHCLVDLTRIHGFWGYYGYYFSFYEWSLYKVYATNRNALILIEDIYEDTYLISCEQPDELITLVIEARDRKRAEILLHTTDGTAE